MLLRITAELILIIATSLRTTQPPESCRACPPRSNANESIGQPASSAVGLGAMSEKSREKRKSTTNPVTDKRNIDFM
jgi:hypothetical protein